MYDRAQLAALDAVVGTRSIEAAAQAHLQHRQINLGRGEMIHRRRRE